VTAQAIAYLYICKAKETHPGTSYEAPLVCANHASKGAVISQLN